MTSAPSVAVAGRKRRCCELAELYARIPSSGSVGPPFPPAVCPLREPLSAGFTVSAIAEGQASFVKNGVLARNGRSPSFAWMMLLRCTRFASLGRSSITVIGPLAIPASEAVMHSATVCDVQSVIASSIKPRFATRSLFPGLSPEFPDGDYTA